MFLLQCRALHKRLALSQRKKDLTQENLDTSIHTVAQLKVSCLKNKNHFIES